MSRKPKTPEFVPSVVSNDRRTIVIKVSEDVSVTISHALPPGDGIHLAVHALPPGDGIHLAVRRSPVFGAGRVSPFSDPGEHASATLDAGMALALSDALREGVWA